jgi:hypothetical protein
VQKIPAVLAFNLYRGAASLRIIARGKLNEIWLNAKV